MNILRAADLALQEVLQNHLDVIADEVGAIPVLLSDSSETKPAMPYIIIQCVSQEEQITPGSGIFKVSGEIIFRSHTKEPSTDDRQVVIDAINDFAYDATAAKLSGIENFHCHGWQPTTGDLASEPETKSYAYNMKYWVYCMAIDNE